MEADPQKSQASLATPAPPKPSTAQTPPAESASPWEEYFIGKKVPAGRLLAKMEALRKKGGMPVPDDALRTRFAEALIVKPDRVARIVALLQSSTPHSDTIRRIALDFAEIGIKRLCGVTLPEPLDAAGFRAAVSSWIAGIPKKPLKPR